MDPSTAVQCAPPPRPIRRWMRRSSPPWRPGSCPPPRAGDVDADYPIIFAHDSAEESRLEADLQTKVAALSPTETPEYAAAPMPEATPLAAPSAEAAGAPSAGAAASPAVASVPSPEAAPSAAVAPGPPPAPVVAKPRHKPRREAALGADALAIRAGAASV